MCFKIKKTIQVDKNPNIFAHSFYEKDFEINEGTNGIILTGNYFKTEIDQKEVEKAGLKIVYLDEMGFGGYATIKDRVYSDYFEDSVLNINGKEYFTELANNANNGKKKGKCEMSENNGKEVFFIKLGETGQMNMAEALKRNDVKLYRGNIIDQYEGDDISYHGSPQYEMITKIKDEEGNVFVHHDPERILHQNRVQYATADELQAIYARNVKSIKENIAKMYSELRNMEKNINQFIGNDRESVQNNTGIKDRMAHAKENLQKSRNERPQNRNEKEMTR